MRYHSNKTGTSRVVPSWVPATLRDDLEAIAAQRGMAVDALVQEILLWGLEEERLQKEAFSRITPGVSQLTPKTRRRLLQNAMRYGPEDPDAALLHAIVQAWLYAPERALPQPVPEPRAGSVARDAAIAPTKTAARHKEGQPREEAKVILSPEEEKALLQKARPKKDPGSRLPKQRSSKLGASTVRDMLERGDQTPEGQTTHALDPQALSTALTTVVHACYGDDRAITLAYQLFQDVNAHLFADAVPMPLIIRGLTPYSHGFSWLHVQGPMPILFLHPTLFGASELSQHNRKETEKVWGVPVTWLSPYLLRDVIVHECIHAHLAYNKEQVLGPTSHNNDAWVAEVNRLLPLLGFRGLTAGRSKTVRVPVAADRLAREVADRLPREVTDRLSREAVDRLAREEVFMRQDTLTPTSRVQRVTEGNLPFDAVARFPVGVRMYLQEPMDFQELPKTKEEQGLLAANTAVNAHLAAATYYTRSGQPYGVGVGND